MSRRPQAARERASVIWGLVVFAALQLGLALAVRLYLPQLHDPEYGSLVVQLKKQVQSEPEPRPKVIMLGSSRTYHGFRPDRLATQALSTTGPAPIVFNFGIPGAGPVTHLISLRRLLNDGIRPDLLLVEITPVLLARQGKKPIEVGAFSVDRAYPEEWELLQSYGFPISDQPSDAWQNWLVPWYRYRVNILNYAAPQWLPRSTRWDWIPRPDATGWRSNPMEKADPAQHRRFVAAAYKTFGSYLQDFRLGQPACTALKDLLRLCQEENIPAAIVIMPEGEEFQSWYPPGAWDRIHAFLDAVSQEYGVPLINARDWLDDENFSDSHHLTANGADRFTRRFEQEALRPLLERLHTRSNSGALPVPSAVRIDPHDSDARLTGVFPEP